MNRKETGVLGEKLAVHYLIQKGYRIVETNFRYREGVVDIILVKEDTLVFVKVRTKHSSLFGTPEESITETQKVHLLTISCRYCETQAGLPANWRINVVGVELDKNNAVRRINNIESAVESD
jgi:putative endonuclease